MVNKNKNKAIKIFFIISIALHASILLCFTDIFSAKTPERRIEVDLMEIAEENIRSSEFPLMPKRVNVNYANPILHQQAKYRQYPKTIVESIKETKYKPISVASISNFFPKHYDFNNTNKNKGKVSPLFYYQQLIKQKIEENKRYPLLAKNKGIEGKVWVKFEILKDGKVKDIKIVKSSHHQILDKAAIERL